MQITSKKTIESIAVPGVTFTVRRLNKIQRAKRDRPVMAERLRFGTALREREAIKPMKEPARVLSADLQKEYDAFNYEATLLYEEYLVPASISAALVSITGLEIDGTAITSASALLESGTTETDTLFDEIYGACESASGLSDAERKNSKSPITSDVVVGDKNPDTPAAPASETDSTN